MIKTKDAPVVKTPKHIVVLEQMIPHDMAASELVASVLEKLKISQEEINSVMLQRESTIDVALVALPFLDKLLRKAITRSVIEYNNSLPEAKRQQLEDLEFDLQSLLVRCELFQGNSSLLRDQLKELSQASLPMNPAVFPDCTLPLTPEELEFQRLVKEQEAAAAAAAAKQQKKGGGPKKTEGKSAASKARAARK